MATYCPEDISSRELSCPICFEDYDIHDNARAPKLLLCLHTFCLECTRKLWHADGTLECSLCRMIHEQVTLDDLFDNPVIVQYLRQESEQRDLDLARRIDEEMRLGECVTSGPDVEADIKPVSRWEPEVPKVEKCNDLPDHQAQAPEVQVQAANNYSRDNIIIDFFDEVMGDFTAVTHSEENGTLYNQNNNEDEDEDQVEEEEDGANNESDDIREEMGPHDDEEEEEEQDMVDAANPAFSLSNIQALFGQIDEDPSSESDNSSDGDAAASSLLLGNFLAMISQRHEDDNNEEEEEDEDEEEEEEEEERWHSASDEFNIPLWADEERHQLHNTSEVEESDISDWQIVTPESLLDE